MSNQSDREKLEKLIEVLRWYSNPTRYVSATVYIGGGHGPSIADTDCGQRARAVLAEINGED